MGLHITDPIKVTLETASENAKEYNAIWDTGATNTVVTRKIVKDCGLKQVGVITMNTTNGNRLSKQYLISLFLPNSVAVYSTLLVCEANVAGANVLIGMDVISQGDFALGSPNGKTIFSFRIPSQQATDFRS